MIMVTIIINGRNFRGSHIATIGGKVFAKILLNPISANVACSGCSASLH